MLSYEIAHHVPGRIRIKIPLLKKLSLPTLLRLSDQTPIPVVPGILDVQPNPLSGSIVIVYDPQKIDIVKYLEKMASSKEVEEMIRTISKV